MLEGSGGFYKLALNVRQRFLALSDQNAISQVDQCSFRGSVSGSPSISQK